MTIETTDEVGAIGISKIIGRISYGNGNLLLMHANADITKKTLQRLDLKLEGPINKLPCMPCAIGKAKRKKSAKLTQTQLCRP